MGIHTAPPRTPRLLVVDDYEDGRDMLSELLRVRGFHVDTAASGCEALTLVRALRPDLVLLDLTLPDIDGFEVARRMQEDPTTKGIHVVMLTAHVSAELQRQAEALGCRGFVTKPCAPSELVHKIDAVLLGTPAAPSVPAPVV
jgi:two-component system, cell cycle response regulator DivK